MIVAAAVTVAGIGHMKGIPAERRIDEKKKNAEADQKNALYSGVEEEVGHGVQSGMCHTLDCLFFSDANWQISCNLWDK